MNNRHIIKIIKNYIHYKKLTNKEFIRKTIMINFHCNKYIFHHKNINLYYLLGRIRHNEICWDIKPYSYYDQTSIDTQLGINFTPSDYGQISKKKTSFLRDKEFYKLLTSGSNSSKYFLSRKN